MKYYFFENGPSGSTKVKDKDYVKISDITFGHRKNNG